MPKCSRPLFPRSPARSTTSQSDDDDDDIDETVKSSFFPDTPNDPVVFPAKWSHRPATASPPIASPLSPSLIARLPPEILIQVFKHLYSHRDLYSVTRVCKAWCECSIELLWHKPNIVGLSTIIRMLKVMSNRNQMFTYAHFIRRLNFLALGPELVDSMFHRFGKCIRLERLTLVNCTSLSTQTLCEVLPACHNLVALDLTGVNETTDQVLVRVAPNARRLQGINLTGCKKVSDLGIMALAAHCPLLRRVKLSGLSTITDDSVSLLAKSCPLLLELDLNCCKLITDVSVRDIWVYSTHMRELRLSQCSELTDKAFPAPTKHEISLNNPFPSSAKTASDQLPPLIIDRVLEHLRMLDLTACGLITDDAVEGIISRAPKIRNLVLSKCSLLSDKAVESICALGRNIHYLHLGHATKITDRSVRSLARSCTRLRYVDFANCVKLTDMSVFELSSLPKLRRVGLVRVNNLTDEAVFALADRHATLERIHLSYCDQITLMAVHFLLQKLHKLTHLSLTGVPAFRTPELQRFCRPPPMEFNLSQRAAFCVFSGKGIAELRSYLTEFFDHITEMNATDDTEYEDDEDDQLQDEDSRATMEYDDDTEDGEEGSVVAATTVLQGQQRSPRRPNAHPVFQHNLSTSHITRSPGPTAQNTEGIEQGMSDMGYPTPQPSTSRTRGFGHRPLVEPQSPPASDIVSNRSEGSSATGTFFRNYDDTSRNNNGTLTPDLNYAEIGHGRGAMPTQHGFRGWADGLLQLNANYVPATVTPNQQVLLQNPIARPSHPAPPTPPPAQSTTEHEGRGRSVRRSLQFASSLFFGRSSHHVDQGEGNSSG